ncbi:MAG: protein translocase subunit SecF [Christensenellaceae bacterium]|jgi:preprotein translocase subunit SecF|nr:protein translocase subunit SecF [Christensenellaceae bacterium]
MSFDFKKPNLRIANAGKKTIILPAVIMAIGIIMFFVFIGQGGFNLGLDFTGGSIIKVEIETTQNNIDDVRNIVSDFTKCDVQKEESSSGGKYITVKFAETNEDKVGDIITALKTAYGETNVSESDSISGSTSAEKVQSIIWAVLAALAGIMLYMLFRFKFTSGMAALIALMHDVLIMIAMVVIFRVQINSPFIAAVITIVGYSINNTLVLMDRIREYENNNNDAKTLSEIVDKSINDTFGRTMIMTATTLVPVVVLGTVAIIMNLTSLTEFALPIIFGLIAGTYSSLFLVAPMYNRFESARLRKLKRHNIN